MREPRSVREDLVEGVRVGLYLAVVWTVAASFSYIISGGKSFERLGITFPIAILGYVAVGLLCGGVWALLRPLAQSWWGAAILGFIVALPACMVMLYVVWSDAPWRDLLKLSLIMSVVFGPAAGIVLRWDSR